MNSQEKYDEYGRLIVNDEGVNTGKLEYKIAVGLISDIKNRGIKNISTYELSNTSNAAVFLYDTNPRQEQELLEKEIIIKDLNGTIIWSANIVNASNIISYIDDTKYEKIYISEKALNLSTLKQEDMICTICINGVEDNIKILEIIKGNEQKKDIPPIKAKSTDTKERRIKEKPDSINKNDVLMSQKSSGSANNERPIAQKNNNSLKNEKMMKSKPEIKNKEMVKSQTILENKPKETKESMKNEVILQALKYHNTQINTYSNQNLAGTDINYDILIEKIRNKYIVLVKNLSLKPMYLLDQYNKYFEFEGEIDEFILKIKEMMIKMYRFTEEEFNSLRILIINDDNFNPIKSSYGNVITRIELLKEIRDKYIIIDFLNSSPIIVINDKLRTEIQLGVVDNLDFQSFYIQIKDKFADDLAVYDEKTFEEEQVCLLDILI